MGNEHQLLLIPLHSPDGPHGERSCRCENERDSLVFAADGWPMKSRLKERDLETADMAQFASVRASWKAEN